MLRYGVLQELEKHTAAFVDQARLLATWDSAVLSNRHALLDLEQELRTVHAGQEALDRQLGMIETHQKVDGPWGCALHPGTLSRACCVQSRCFTSQHDAGAFSVATPCQTLVAA